MIGLLRVEVGELVKVLDSTFFTHTCFISDVAKNSRVLGVCPVRELVVAELEVLGIVAVVVLVNEPVPMNESL